MYPQAFEDIMRWTNIGRVVPITMKGELDTASPILLEMADKLGEYVKNPQDGDKW